MPELRVYQRWLTRRDLREVLAIERASFDNPWSEDEFLRHLRRRNCIGMVAKPLGSLDVVAFFVYELHKGHVALTDFAVHPDARRLGVGRQMAAELVDQASCHHLSRVVLAVDETQVDAHLFWRAVGFRAVGVDRNAFRDSEGAAYVFERRWEPEAAGAARA